MASSEFAGCADWPVATLLASAHFSVEKSLFGWNEKISVPMVNCVRVSDIPLMEWIFTVSEAAQTAGDYKVLVLTVTILANWPITADVTLVSIVHGPKCHHYFEAEKTCVRFNYS